MFLKICGLVFQYINSDVTRPSSTTNEVVPQCIVRQENLLDHSLTFIYIIYTCHKKVPKKDVIN